MKDQEHKGSDPTKGTDHWDGFEKEAAEGFALLNSDAAVADLKARTDANMKAMLNAKQAPKQTPWYRLAIAAMFIFAGLGVVVWLLPNKKTEVAVKDQSKAPEVPIDTAPLPSATMAQEPLNTPLPEQKIAPIQISTNQNKDDADNAGLLLQEQSVAAAKEAEVAVSSDMTAAQQKSKSDLEQRTSEREEAPMLAKEERKKESEASAKKSMTMVAASPVATSPAVVSSGAATYAWNPNTRNSSADSVHTEIATSMTGIVIVNAVKYPGGNTALRKDIQTILVKAQCLTALHLQFDIDKNGKVVKTQLLEPSTLSKEQELKALEAIKGVKHFQVTLVEGGQLPAMYDFEFKPK